IGFFSQMARAREEARDLPGRLLQVGAAAIRAFMRSGRFLLDIEIDGAHRRISTYAVLVTCNRFGGQDWRRDTLDGGALEIHIAQDEHAFARLKAGADLLNGSWRENSGIESRLARRIVVRARRHRAFVSTDGERRRESLPLHYEVKPRSLTVLAPNGVNSPQ
ncbi:MAG: diacylglycerol kinase family protein, partial [Pseudorhodoplanes sp.]